jgi:host factor-I protein
METNLLDRMLNSYLTEQALVTVTLQNKIRVTGKLKAFDSYVIVMEGPKREIIYRHAVSSLSPAVPEEQRAQPAPQRPGVTKPSVPQRPQKSAPRKPRPAHPQPTLAASSNEPMNSSMKDGLLKWMQEQKAAK